MDANIAQRSESLKSILILMEKSDVSASFEHPPTRDYSGTQYMLTMPLSRPEARMTLEIAVVLPNLLGQAQKSSDIEEAVPHMIKSVAGSSEASSYQQRRVTGLRVQGEGIDRNMAKIKENLDHRRR